MNCANHADQSAVAYCRTCGKALCANCTRPVRGVIYCEDCLGARMEAPSGANAPAAGFVSGGAGSWAQVPPTPVAPIPREFWLGSFLSALARFTRDSTRRDWHSWEYSDC